MPATPKSSSQRKSSSSSRKRIIRVNYSIYQNNQDGSDPQIEPITTPLNQHQTNLTQSEVRETSREEVSQQSEALLSVPEITIDNLDDPQEGKREITRQSTVALLKKPKTMNKLQRKAIIEVFALDQEFIDTYEPNFVSGEFSQMFPPVDESEIKIKKEDVMQSLDFHIDKFMCSICQYIVQLPAHACDKCEKIVCGGCKKKLGLSFCSECKSSISPMQKFQRDVIENFNFRCSAEQCYESRVIKYGEYIKHQKFHLKPKKIKCQLGCSDIHDYDGFRMHLVFSKEQDFSKQLQKQQICTRQTLKCTTCNYVMNSNRFSSHQCYKTKLAELMEEHINKSDQLTPASQEHSDSSSEWQESDCDFPKVIKKRPCPFTNSPLRISYKLQKN